MNLSSLTDWALSAVVTYGPYAVALLVLCGALGAPVPGTLVVLAAGAFARQGLISWPVALAAALIGVVIGDSLAYLLGRLGGPWVDRWAGGSASWGQAHSAFNHYGGWAIFFSRWLVTPLGVPVSILAGLGAYVFWRFILLDFAGEILWVSGYGALGYAVGLQFEYVGQIVSDMGGILVGLLIVLAGAVIGWRIWRRTVATPPAQVQDHMPAPAPASAATLSREQPLIDPLD